MELPNRPIKDPYQELPIKDYSYVNTQKRSHKKKNHTWLYVICCVIVLALLGVGAFAYGHYTKDKTPKKTTASSSQKKTTVSTKPNINTSNQTPSIAMTAYSSTPFGLTLNYPTSWTVTANGNTALTISSPETALIADTGSSVEGKIVLNVVNAGQIPAAFGSTSVAVLNSQDMSFTSPTSDQAAQTYLSFVQYPATTTMGGLDAIFITGNDGYLKDQSIPSSDISKVSPLIFINFEQCQDQACSSPTALTISSTMWSKSSFSAPILDTLKSLSFN